MFQKFWKYKPVYTASRPRRLMFWFTFVTLLNPSGNRTPTFRPAYVHLEDLPVQFKLLRKVKVKVVPLRTKLALKAGQRSRSTVLDLGCRKEWVATVNPLPVCPREKTRRTLIFLGFGLDGFEKSRPSPGVEPRTVQRVTVRYAGCPISASPSEESSYLNSGKNLRC